VAVHVADVNPKTIENAKRQFVELYGSSLVLNTYLKIALVLVSLLALGLLFLNFRTQAQYANLKPLVIRIDDVGRAEAVQYDATGYQPQPSPKGDLLDGYSRDAALLIRPVSEEAGGGSTETRGIPAGVWVGIAGGAVVIVLVLVLVRRRGGAEDRA